MRNHGYWRLGYQSFEAYLEAKSPDCRHKAYYLMSIHGHLSKFVKVLDLSFGGVGLMTDDYEVPESFLARILAPFLPDAEFILHRVYSSPILEGKKRVGCSFTLATPPGMENRPDF